MVRAACHCGAARLTVEPGPQSVTDCNCSICRRYGALWAYTLGGEATLLEGADELEAYIWGEREYGLQRCKSCGCVTHIVRLEEPHKVMAVNARMFVDFDPASVTVRRWDNAHTGRFWTRADAPPAKGIHPPMAPRAPDDWL